MFMLTDDDFIPDFVAFSEVKNYIPKYRGYKDFLI